MQNTAILFDLDGTLIDSAPGIFSSFRYALSQYGLTATDDELRGCLGPPLRTSFLHWLPSDKIEQAIDHYRTVYRAGEAFHGAIYAGVEEMLQTLQAQGYVLGVATLKAVTFARPVLEHYGLAHYFAYIGGPALDGSNDSKEMILREVLAQPCMQGKNALMVGDRVADVIGANACGIPCIGVLYGYGSREELAAHQPAVLVDTPEELLQYIIKGNANKRSIR